jgi:hypothetical protein
MSPRRTRRPQAQDRVTQVVQQRRADQAAGEQALQERIAEAIDHPSPGNSKPSTTSPRLRDVGGQAGEAFGDGPHDAP